MGGPFSTRWDRHRKMRRVEECLQLPIAVLVGDKPPAAGQTGMLRWPKRSCEITFTFAMTHRVELRYRVGQEQTAVRILLELLPLPTPRGGTRYLTRCPLSVNDVPCERRVATLLLPPGARYFGCRHCHRLTYASRQQHDKRATALLKSGQLRALAENPAGQSVQMLGLILAAIRADDRRFDRLLKKFQKPKPRRRKKR